MHGCDGVQAGIDWTMFGNDPYSRPPGRSCKRSFRSDFAATGTFSAVELASNAAMITTTIVE
jgi:hypothetical protein